MACGRAGHRGEAWLKKGLLGSKQRCPSSLTTTPQVEVRRTVMDRVVIGMDPHKRSVTIEARDTREVLRATGRFPTSTGLSGDAGLPGLQRRRSRRRAAARLQRLLATVSGCWTCRRSWPPGPGCSTPGRAG
jgi:hypothetical protein